MAGKPIGLPFQNHWKRYEFIFSLIWYYIIDNRNGFNYMEYEMKILFLDDNSVRTKSFLKHFPQATCVETSDECILELKSGPWDVVCLDHDLGGDIFVDPLGKNTGMEVVRFVEKDFNGLMPVVNVKCFFVHSWNYVATPIMAEQLRKANQPTVIQKYGDDLIDMIKSFLKSVVK